MTTQEQPAATPGPEPARPACIERGPVSCHWVKRGERFCACPLRMPLKSVPDAAGQTGRDGEGA